MGEGEMGMVCPAVRVTMVMVGMVVMGSVKREGKRWASGRGDGKRKVMEGEEGE